MLSTASIHPQQPPRITRKQFRHYKREARAKAYRKGGINVTADVELLPEAVADKILAAREKRERKAEKRANDAMTSTIGKLQWREAIA